MASVRPFIRSFGTRGGTGTARRNLSRSSRVRSFGISTMVRLARVELPDRLAESILPVPRLEEDKLWPVHLDDQGDCVRPARLDFESAIRTCYHLLRGMVLICGPPTEAGFESAPNGENHHPVQRLPGLRIDDLAPPGPRPLRPPPRAEQAQDESTRQDKNRPSSRHAHAGHNPRALHAPSQEGVDAGEGMTAWRPFIDARPEGTSSSQHRTVQPSSAPWYPQRIVEMVEGATERNIFGKSSLPDKINHRTR